MPYKVTLATVVSIVVTVDTDDDERAENAAYEVAREFGNRYHADDRAGLSWVVDVNNEWQYEDAQVEKV